MKRNEEGNLQLEKALFYRLMRNASFVSYAVGIFAIASSIAQSVITYAALGPIETAIATNQYNSSTLTLISQALTSILPITLIILGITVMLTLFFAYYTFMIGGAYEIGSIKTAGVAYAIYELAILPILLAAYELFPLLPALMTNPNAALSQVYGVVVLILVGGLLAFAFLIIFIVAYCVGLNHLGKETGIGLFGNAMTLAIIGIILSFLNSILASLGVPINIGALLLQVSIILFGMALSKAGKEGRLPRRLAERNAPS